MGLKRYYSWNTIHGFTRLVLALLGCTKDEYGSGLEEREFLCFKYIFSLSNLPSQMQVIISDASVPGEGEHKIMDFIRRQRSNPGHDPNSQHVIYGLVRTLLLFLLI